MPESLTVGLCFGVGVYGMGLKLQWTTLHSGYVTAVHIAGC